MPLTPLTSERRDIQARLVCLNTWLNLKQMRAAKSYLSLCRKRDELQEKKITPWMLLTLILLLSTLTALIISYYEYYR